MNARRYRIAGKFQGVQFSWVGDFYHFVGLIFADACDHAHCTLHNRAYFVGLVLAVSLLSAKTAKIQPLKNFPLYSKYRISYLHEAHLADNFS